jgi:hypothetical protein
MQGLALYPGRPGVRRDPYSLSGIGLPKIACLCFARQCGGYGSRRSPGRPVEGSCAISSEGKDEIVSRARCSV